MTNHQTNFIDWILFMISALGFCIASIASFLTLFGSIFFLIVCLGFMIPIYRKEK